MHHALLLAACAGTAISASLSTTLLVLRFAAPRQWHNVRNAGSPGLSFEATASEKRACTRSRAPSEEPVDQHVEEAAASSGAAEEEGHLPTATPPRLASKHQRGCMQSTSLPQPSPMGKRNPLDPHPRDGYLSWDDYFMALAFLSAERSKDPNKQVGACIVDRNHVILGIGYNGFPTRCSDGALPWAKQSRDGDVLQTKYPYVVHAEANALLNKNTASVAGASVYVTMFPCNECAKLLIQAGIKEVVYHESKIQEPAGSRDNVLLSDQGTSRTGSSAAASGLEPACALCCAATSDLCACAIKNLGTSTGTTAGSRATGSIAAAPAGKPRHGVGSAAAGQAHGLPCPAREQACDPCYVASMRLLNLAGVRLRQHRLRRRVVLGA